MGNVQSTHRGDLRAARRVGDGAPATQGPHAPDRERIAILYATARRVLRASSMVEVVHEALLGLQQLVPAWRYSVGLIDPARDTYTVLGALGAGAAATARDVTAPLETFAGDLDALRQGNTQIDRRIRRGKGGKLVRGLLRGSSLRSQVLVPIREQAHLLGTLNLGSLEADAFDDAHVFFAQEVAALLADGLQRERIKDDLLQARDHALHANLAKTAFLEEMNHELRTPLNAILGYIELILDLEADGELSPEALHDDLGRIHRTASYLFSLINDVLDLAKLEAGKMEVTVTSVDLASLVEAIEDVVKPLVTSGHNTWSLDCPEEVWILADPMRMRQVLLNLVGNAAKFTQQGAVGIRVRTDARKVEIDVVDTGVGIPAASLERLFEPFEQAHENNGQHVGTGLGLAITKRYVELMGGTIQVTSEEGRGSTFRVQMPLVVPDG